MEAKTLLLVLGLTFPMLVSSQSLSEKVGGVKTKFLITSGSELLNKEEQLLIQRAESYYDYDCDSGYGYGYQTFYLEFLCTERLKTKRSIGKRRDFYSLELFDANGEQLALIELGLNDLKLTNSPNRPDRLTYSISLKNVPIILLDETTEINIQQQFIRRTLP